VPFRHYEVPRVPSQVECVSEWELTSWFESVCVSERELTSLSSFRPIKCRTNLVNRISDERTDGRTDTHTNPKPRHTQENTHYTEWYPNTEWYPLRTHPRGYPLHWVIHWYLVIFPLTESSHNPPKSLPMTQRDSGFVTNKPDIEWYPLHGRIPLTLSYTHYLEFQSIGYPWHWVIPITLSSSQ
jgi:hypothetical protein